MTCLTPDYTDGQCHCAGCDPGLYAALIDRVTKLEKKVERIGQTLRDSVAAVARPGDVVLLTFGRELTDEDIDLLTEGFQPLKEQGIDVAFTDQVEAVAVLRPGDEDINDWAEDV